MANQVSQREVKIAYIMNGWGKHFFRQRPAPIFELQREYEAALKQLGNLDDPELDAKISDKVRTNQFSQMQWSRSYVPLSQMGPFHKMMGLPIEFTVGNIIETADHIKRAVARGDIFHADRFVIMEDGRENPLVPQRLLDKLASIQQFAYHVFPRFIPILMPGGIERDLWWNNEIRSPNQPRCAVLPYDIIDGNARLLAMALEARSGAVAYCGSYQGNLADIHEQDKRIIAEGRDN